jgi:hypothetical protein
MSLRENISAAFREGAAYNKMMYPATHDEAQAAISRMVMQIQIICDQYGYDPTEWLNDETAQPSDSGDETKHKNENS